MVLRRFGGRFLLGKPCAARTANGISSSSSEFDDVLGVPVPVPGPAVEVGKTGLLKDICRFGLDDGALPDSPVTFIICCRYTVM
jgi:hypothetical protein